MIIKKINWLDKVATLLRTIMAKSLIVITVDEDESKNLVFVSFSINDDYQPTLIKRVTTSETDDEKEKQQTIQSVMPVLRGFMSAISD